MNTTVTKQTNKNIGGTKMKFNKWTLGLAAVGAVSLTSVAQAEEKMSAFQAALSSTTISGYINTSAHWDLGSAPATAGYAYGGLGAKNDGFNLNVVDLNIEKPLDENEWAAGYRAEMWFGPDANGIVVPGFGAINGLGTGSLGGSFQDFAIKQAYVALRAPVGNGIDFKIGVFDTVIGYESANAGDNPNYTRSWGNTIEPIEHTGVLATYRFSESIVASVGVANAWNSTINGRVTAPNGAANQGTGQTLKTYMASVALTAPESFGFLSGGTLYAGVVNGEVSGSVIAPSTGGGATAARTSYYAGVTVPTPVEGLKAGFSFDGVHMSGKAGVDTSDSFAVATYLSFRVTEKLTVNGRLDYLSLGGDGIGAPGAPGTGPDLIFGGAGPFASGDEFLTTTVTADYVLWDNVISRVEFRWDHDLNGNSAVDGKHFGNGTRANDYLIAANVIYKF
jgi:hypothetical protein